MQPWTSDDSLDLDLDSPEASPPRPVARLTLKRTASAPPPPPLSRALQRARSDPTAAPTSSSASPPLALSSPALSSSSSPLFRPALPALRAAATTTTPEQMLLARFGASPLARSTPLLPGLGAEFAVAADRAALARAGEELTAEMRLGVALLYADGASTLCAAEGDNPRAAPLAVLLAADGDSARRWALPLALAEARVWLQQGLLGDARRTLVCMDAKALLVALGPGVPVLCALRDPRVACWLLAPDNASGTLETLCARLRVAEERSGGLHARLLARSMRLEEAAGHLLRRWQLWDAYVTQEMAVVPMLAWMERAGVPFDAGPLRAHSDAMKAKMAMLTQDACGMLGRPLALGSNPQVAQALYDDLGLTPGAATAGGARAVTREELQRLRDQHPLVGRVLEYRELGKLCSTYVDGLLARVVRTEDALIRPGEAVPRIATQWLQCNTSTGRLASANPNVQNLPREARVLCLPRLPPPADGTVQMEQVRLAVRSAFVARPGWRLVCADYSQMEMRLLASYANDRQLIDIFRQSLDIHREVAALWKAKRSADVSDSERETAKRLVYACMYGMGPDALAKQLECSLEQARRDQASFLQRFRAVNQWMVGVRADAHRHGHVVTAAGRIRLLPDAVDPNAEPDAVARARRQSVNTVVQGSAADILKAALLGLHRRLLGDAEMRQWCVPLASIHDEIMLEVRQDRVLDAARLLREVMTLPGRGLNVPLEVSVAAGESWGAMSAINDF